MSFFDFFFPEQAQASHLRKLVAQNHLQALNAHKQRMSGHQALREESARTRNIEQRVANLEKEVGQAGLLIEALLEMLEETGAFTRDDLEKRVREIDIKDGVADGRMTPPKPPNFTPTRSWPGKGKRAPE
jgi:hypothetical protein